MTFNQTPNPLPAPSAANRILASFRQPRVFVLSGLIAASVALVGGFALADGMGHAGWDRGMRMAFLQHGVAHALDSVGATSQQEAAIHDIIAAKLPDLVPDPKEHDAMRKQAFDILAAPTVDRAAAEKFRADLIARVDAKSKIALDGILQIADQLKPEQRAQLATRLESMRRHGPMGFGGPPREHFGPDADDDGSSKD